MYVLFHERVEHDKVILCPDSMFFTNGSKPSTVVHGTPNVHLGEISRLLSELRLMLGSLGVLVHTTADLKC